MEGKARQGEARQGKNEASESLSKLSMELGLRFPPSTRLIGVPRSIGMDDAVRVKLEIAATEFPLSWSRRELMAPAFARELAACSAPTGISGIRTNPSPCAPGKCRARTRAR
jgi:hypothetical protein